MSFTPTIQIDKVVRFQASAAGTSSVSNIDIADMFCVAATAISAYQLAKAIRIRKVEMWGPPPATLAPVTVSVEWPGVDGNSVQHSDTSIGATRVAHLCAKPPKEALCSMWRTGSAVTNFLFTLNYPINAIVDVHVSLSLQEQAGAIAVTAAVAGATVGQLYCRKLDSTTSALLPPISYISI
jgi:hypothetical protein